MSAADVPDLDYLLSLRDRRVRDREGHFIAEGLRFAHAAVRHRASIEAVVVAPGLLRHTGGWKITRNIGRRGVPIAELTATEFRRLSLSSSPQGVALLLRQRWFSLGRPRPRRRTCWVAFERVHSPGNLGTVLRTCEATGATGAVLLGDTVDPYDPVAVRASMGAIFSQTLCRVDPLRFRRWSQRHRCLVVGASPDADRDYRSLSYRGPVVLMVGCERRGMSLEQKALCHELVRIPMVGPTDSLNLGVAASLLLYEVLNQRSPAPAGAGRGV